MIFDILSSQVRVSKWQDQKARTSLAFDVAPRDRYQLDIGDDYIVCGAGYLPMRDKARQPVQTSVTIVSDPELISHIRSESPIVGYAQFFKERRDDFDGEPARLLITVVVEPERFAELVALKVNEPGGATLNASIEALDFGWEPDGSHQVWRLDEAERSHCKTVSDFSISIETFWSHERAIRDTENRRLNIILAQSRDITDRKLAEANAAETAVPYPYALLLKQCRALLAILVALAIMILIRLR